MNADLARKRARQQNSWTHPVRLDPSWETNPDSTTLPWTCQTCEGRSLPLPWLKRTNEKCARKDKGTTAAGQARLEGLCPHTPRRQHHLPVARVTRGGKGTGPIGCCHAVSQNWPRQIGQRHHALKTEAEKYGWTRESPALEKACLWRCVAGGQWTCAAFECTGCDNNPTCPLCGEGIDTPFRRVWECSNPRSPKQGGKSQA